MRDNLPRDYLLRDYLPRDILIEASSFGNDNYMLAGDQSVEEYSREEVVVVPVVTAVAGKRFL